MPVLSYYYFCSPAEQLHARVPQRHALVLWALGVCVLLLCCTLTPLPASAEGLSGRGEVRGKVAAPATSPAALLAAPADLSATPAALLTASPTAPSMAGAAPPPLSMPVAYISAATPSPLSGPVAISHSSPQSVPLSTPRSTPVAAIATAKPSPLHMPAPPKAVAPKTVALVDPSSPWTQALSGRGELRGRASPMVRAAGDVSGQHTVMDSGTVANLHGASIASGTVTGNSATLNGGTVGTEVSGGRTGNGDAINNVVTINGGSLSIVRGGTTQAGDAVGNKVFVNADIADRPVIGGDSLNGNVRDNTVVMNSGSAGDLWGGTTNVGAATGNRVVVHSGQVHYDVIGGQSGNGEASGNSVSINGGYFLGNGISQMIAGGASGSGVAVNNTVTISGSPDLSMMQIYGGKTTGTGHDVDVRSGNTLHINGFQGNIRSIQNFQHINFLLPAHSKNGDTIITSAVDMTAPAGQAATTVRITGMEQGTNRLYGGDVVRLMYGNLDTSGLDFSGGTFRQGLFMEYTYDLQENAGTGTRTGLDARIIGAALTPETEAPTDGPNADGGIINGGADLVAGAGMDNALAAARLALRPHEQANPWGVGVFGVFSGGHTRYTIPSRLKLQSTHYATGFTKLFDFGDSELLAGGYFDAGFGHYMSQRTVRGRPTGGAGDSNYYGGGILARYARKKGPLQGAYAEATARTGLVESDYQSKDLQAAAGRAVQYERRVPYYSAHGGMGYVLPLSDHSSLDLYGKVFWSRLDGSTQRIAGDEFLFEPLDSLRLRGGARFNYAVDDSFSLYTGAAYEAELDGHPRATVHGIGVKGADMRGSTAIGEFGLSFTMGAEDNFSMDIGGQGFVGKREGLMGTVRAQLAF